eukprot:PhF_6_TR27119/c0_g2_i1/m.39516
MHGLASNVPQTNPYAYGHNVLGSFDVPPSPRRSLSKEQKDRARKEEEEKFNRRGISAFPSYEEQLCLPDEVVASVKAVALGILKHIFAPIVTLRRKKTYRARLIQNFHVTERVVEKFPFETNPVFAPWTNLDDIVAAFELTPFVHKSNEIVLYQHDISQSGVWYLASGTVEICQKKQWNSKSLGKANREVAAAVRGPKILGEFAMLSEEPRMSTVVCKTQCLFFVLDKHVFRSLFLSLDPHTQNMVNQIGYEQRVSIMKQAYPVNVEHIRKCALFRDFPDDIVQRMIDNFVPLPVPRKGIVCAQGDEAENLFYIANGKVGVY